MSKIAPSSDAVEMRVEPKAAEERPFPMLGISIRGINHFITSIGGREVVGSRTTTEICEEYIKPMTSRQQCSYCDLMQADASLAPDCNTAQVFISHAWKYCFIDVIDALSNHFQNSEKEFTFLWFDLFSNNQHGLSEPPPFSWWCNTFMNAIHFMHRVVMVMAPWENPIPLTRAWCLWEIYCTSKTGAKFEVAMSQRERERFRSMIISDSDVFYDMLGNVDVRNSDAFNVLDKTQIFDVVEKEVGFIKLNDLVNQCMREWVTAEMRSYAAEHNTYDFQSLSCDDIESNKNHDASLEFAVRVECTLARVLSRAGRHDEAIERMNKLRLSLQPVSKSYASALATTYLAYVVHESFNNKLLLPPHMPRLTRALNYERQRFEMGTDDAWLNRYVSPTNFRIAWDIYRDGLDVINKVISTNDANVSALRRLRCEATLSEARLLNMNIHELIVNTAESAVEYYDKAIEEAKRDEVDGTSMKKLKCGLVEAQSEYAYRLAIEGSYSEALPLMRQSVNDLKQLLSDHHPTTLRATTRLADIYDQLDMYTPAKNLYEECIERTLEKFGHRHALYLSLVSKLRDLRLRHGNVWIMFYDRYLYGMVMVFRKQYGNRWYYRWNPDPVFYEGFKYDDRKWPKTKIGYFLYFVLHFTLTWSVVVILLVPMILSLMLHFQLPTLFRRFVTCCMTEDRVMWLYNLFRYDFQNEINYTETYLRCMHLVKIAFWIIFLSYARANLESLYFNIGIFYLVADTLPNIKLLMKSNDRDLEKRIPVLQVHI